MIRRPPRSTLFPSRRSSDLDSLVPQPTQQHPAATGAKQFGGPYASPLRTSTRRIRRGGRPPVAALQQRAAGLPSAWLLDIVSKSRGGTRGTLRIDGNCQHPQGKNNQNANYPSQGRRSCMIGVPLEAIIEQATSSVHSDHQGYSWYHGSSGVVPVDFILAPRDPVGRPGPCAAGACPR